MIFGQSDNKLNETSLPYLLLLRTLLSTVRTNGNWMLDAMNDREIKKYLPGGHIKKFIIINLFIYVFLRNKEEYFMYGKHVK